MSSNATYDVFLSHADRDKPAVEELARRLRSVGIEPFLDKWHLVPGEPWQEALESALERSQTCAVFLGPGHLGPWQNEEMRDALDTLVGDKNHRVVPVLLPGASMPTKKALPPFLRRLTWVEFRAGLDDPQAFHRLVCGIKGIPPGDGPTASESPVKEPTALKQKRPSYPLLLFLATVALVAVIGTLGLLFAPSFSRWLERSSVSTGKPAPPALEECASGEETTEAGIVYVRICPGTFTMGSAKDDRLADEKEKPAHQVTLSEFWLGKTEITNEKYRSFNSHHQGEIGLPATGVSWAEAKAACESFGGRLPTEAEWEYAARAGSQTSWSFGDDQKMLGEYAWYVENSSTKPNPVGMKKPNAWGLQDTHGNVWEWVADWYAPYSNGPQSDPTGPKAGESRILRGGAFFDSPWNLRSAIRFRFKPTLRFWDIGFRCARDPRRQP